MLKKIKDYLLKSNYNGDGLCKNIESTSHVRRYKAHWLAATSNWDSDGNGIIRNSIIKYMGIRYYFYCIDRWAMLPEKSVHVVQLYSY